MYKVYGSIPSRASRVLWMLEEIGQPYEHVKAGPRDPQITALNLSGKIPVLVDGDAVISDSSAIMTYLADKHGALTYPAGSLERAAQDSVFFAMLDELDAVLWIAARHTFILPEDKRAPQVSETAMWEFDRNLQRLEKQFKGPFLLGEKMTIADILLVHCMSWARGARFSLNSDVLNAYCKEMRNRPGYLKLAELAQKS
ncbi:glutathione S-transferase family protein [uncultured Ruegeria sp.]|jgi:glutathione S-transferase|uniref:glutathione S-transferase family protein n=1 Tax=uncultured Ruegeria sp. TaxID=259304 RepID=UPI0026170410|nr:glutathione S-transferase family protein [uncultured Ruegeria sp.]